MKKKYAVMIVDEALEYQRFGFASKHAQAFFVECVQLYVKKHPKADWRAYASIAGRITTLMQYIQNGEPIIRVSSSESL